MRLKEKLIQVLLNGRHVAFLFVIPLGLHYGAKHSLNLLLFLRRKLRLSTRLNRHRRVSRNLWRHFFCSRLHHLRTRSKRSHLSALINHLLVLFQGGSDLRIEQAVISLPSRVQTDQAHDILRLDLSPHTPCRL